MTALLGLLPFLELASDPDAAADGTGGVQIHVDITQLPTIGPSTDGLAGTGTDVPVLLIVLAAALVIGGAALVIQRLRRRG